MPEDYTVFSNAAPIKETPLQTVTFRSGRHPDVWVATTDLSAASSSAKVFEVDWSSGRLLFGDGARPNPTRRHALQFSYSTSPDLCTTASSAPAGRFRWPQGGGCALNASLGAYDLYVADTSNDRIVLAFVLGQEHPASAGAHRLGDQLTTASSSSDLLDTLY
ncbi:MAG: hypothetical protein U0527_06755 [Candidatus Eisenbacteria bacterium]